MDVYQYMSDSPFVTFCLALIAAGVVKFTLTMLINRPLRHMNIRKHGWPPAHCDADGDFREEEKHNAD